MARASLSNLSTFLTKLKSIFSLIGHTHSQYVQNTTYNNKMSGLDSSVSTLSSGKADKATSISNVDLDTLKTAGLYYGVANNGCTNIPSSFSSTTRFWLEVKYLGNSYTVQEITNHNGITRTRIWSSTGGWGEWGTPKVETADASDNSTKIATTAFVNNVMPKKLDISYTDETSVPWKAIASVFASMSAGGVYIGFISNGASYSYYGHKVSSAHGSFIVHHNSGSVWHVYKYSNVWYYHTITCGSATTFTL